MPTYETWLGGRYGDAPTERAGKITRYSSATVLGVAYLLDHGMLSNSVFAKLNYTALVASGLEEKRGTTTKQSRAPDNAVD